MTPSAFSFKLTVPNDPEGVTVVAAMAAHAVDYAGLEAAAGAAFVERVREVATQALKTATGHSCLAVIAAANGQLSVTMGGQTAAQPLPA